MDGGTSIPGRGHFSPLQRVQIGSEVHPAFYPMGIGALRPEVMRPDCDADHSLPSSTETKNDGAVLPLPHTSS
jgi:hypothetical protein